MSNAPTFEFELRGALADREGYYHTRWDRAEKITVRATNKQEAINKADAALGPAPSGRYWTFRVDSIKEVS